MYSSGEVRIWPLSQRCFLLKILFVSWEVLQSLFSMEVHISRYVMVFALLFHHLCHHLRALNNLSLRQSLLLGALLALVKLIKEVLVNGRNIVARLYLHRISLLGVDLIVHVNNHSNLTLVAIFVDILWRFHSQMVFDLSLRLTFNLHSINPLRNLVYIGLLECLRQTTTSCWKILHIPLRASLKDHIVTDWSRQLLNFGRRNSKIIEIVGSHMHVRHIFSLLLSLQIIGLEVVHTDSQWIILFFVSVCVRSNDCGLDRIEIKCHFSSNLRVQWSCLFIAGMETIL